MQVETEIPRFYGLYPGVVVDVQDPLGLKRVQVQIPGMLERSAWAWPMGTAGGGSPGRGGMVSPVVGADVGVMFVLGDIQRPVYLPAHWGVRDGEPEMPLPVRDVPPADAPKVQALQLGNLVVSVDERPGERKLSIEDTVTGDAIVWDLEKQGLRVKMTSGILIECDGLVKVNAAQVTVQDRLVQIDPKPV